MYDVQPQSYSTEHFNSLRQVSNWIRLSKILLQRTICSDPLVSCWATKRIHYMEKRDVRIINEPWLVGTKTVHFLWLSSFWNSDRTTHHNGAWTKIQKIFCNHRIVSSLRDDWYLSITSRELSARISTKYPNESAGAGISTYTWKSSNSLIPRVVHFVRRALSFIAILISLNTPPIL